MIKGEYNIKIISCFLVCQNEECKCEEEIHVPNKTYLDDLYLMKKHIWVKRDEYIKKWRCKKCASQKFEVKEGKMHMPISAEDLDKWISEASSPNS